ncbi:TonB-dependent receptor [Verticiella sediminum]|uniref:TonB-dependent receptor n=1 Tax=Verticiella sediminum TaxID=1247510 RepID=A0A556AIW1_9BURK|nr:TonB-dependent receptor [Verticiella sediminum]TSH92805.1 TonB-dependent receptor [Verticiella sediminum]
MPCLPYLRTPLAAALLALSALAHAQAVHDYDRPAAPLASALNALARDAGVQVLYASEIAAERTAPPLRGRYTPQAALDALLEGSGLAARAEGPGRYVVVPAAEGQPSAATGPDNVATLQAISVVASRTPRAIDELPNTVWIIEREQIEEQARAGVPLKELLGQLVPGLDLGGQMRTNFGQNLRGRAAQVMIDGISLNGSRTLSRQFDSISPFNIERIEVLSGATAVYGGNATGGIINIVTRRSDPADSPFTSEAGLRSGLRGSGDLDWHVAQSVQGGNERLHGRLAVSYERNGAAYDGSGARVLPDITQTDLQNNQAVDVLGTADADLGRAGSLKLLAQLYDSGYHPGDALWLQPGPGDDVLNPSRVEVRGGFFSDVEPRTKRHLLAGDYSLPGVPGGQTLYLKTYHRKESLQFYPFPGADANPLGGGRVPYWSTSTQETTTYGFKALLDKSWDRAHLSYGVDYDHERFTARQSMFDMPTALQSGGLNFAKTDELGRYPSFSTNIWAGYVQGDWTPVDTFTLSAGVRHQRVDIAVDDFAQVAQQRLVSAGYGRYAEAIPGGKNDYAVTLYNAGVVYRPWTGHQLWANYAEGFELADPAKYYGTGASYSLIGERDGYWRLNRYLSVGDTNMAAIKTRSTELGWRYAGGPLQLQAALFHLQSDDAIAVDRSTLTIALSDNKVRNYGLEAQLNYRVGDGWALGGNLLLIRSEEERNGDWVRRGIYYASPSKATVYVGRQWGRWSARAQLAHSFRLKSDVPSFGTGDGETLPSLTLVDVLGSYTFDHGRGRKGTLTAGIQNLFDKTYTTRWAEQASLAYAGSIDPSVLDFKGRGRTVALTYTLAY